MHKIKDALNLGVDLDYHPASVRICQAMEHKRRVSDQVFDSIYDSEIRKLSALHWTPAHVAIALARILVKHPGSVVLDVGSGAGKFCVLGALATKGTFIGVEQRPYFVGVARNLAQILGINRAEFLCGNALDLDWRPFNAVYLFNPFWENIEQVNAIDNSITLSEDVFNGYVFSVQEKLSHCNVGTRVATLNGFGGAMPDGYELKYRRFIKNCYAEVWIKV